jgi:hypothetical protein
MCPKGCCWCCAWQLACDASITVASDSFYARCADDMLYERPVVTEKLVTFILCRHMRWSVKSTPGPLQGQLKVARRPAHLRKWREPER